MAIDAGYRLIDTAWAYDNEAAIGKGVRAKIAQGIIKRTDIFIVTKVSSLEVKHSMWEINIFIDFSCGTHSMRPTKSNTPAANL